MKRILAMLLALCLILGQFPTAVFAEEASSETLPADETTAVSEAGKEAAAPTEAPELPPESPVIEPVKTQKEAPVLELNASDAQESPFLTADTETTVEITAAGENAYFRFTPEFTESYTFYSDCDYDTYGALYDSDMNCLSENDDGGRNYNFSITCTLQAGVTYFWCARFLHEDLTGSFPVMLQTNHAAECVVTTPATCTEDGEMTCTCTICGTVYTEMIPAAHTWNEERVCSICGESWYASGECGDSVTWLLNSEGTLTISGEGEIAPMYDGRPWNAYMDQIYTVVIEEGVTAVPDSAFSSCSNLTSVTIGKDVSSFSIFACSNCPNLTGYYVDADNAGYSSDNFGVLLNKDMTVLYRVPERLAGEYTVPETVWEISGSAFEVCSNLTGVTIGPNVSYIDNYAFVNCGSLAAIYVNAENPYFSHDDAGVLFNKEKTELLRAPGAISGHYTLPASVTVIGNNAFTECSGLEGVTLPEGLQTIGYNAFGCCRGLLEITIPGSVETISEHAFTECSAMKSVTLLEGVPYISSYMFFYCTGLTDVVIPDTVTAVGDCAFYQCSSLAEITLPDGVTSIGENSFGYCAALEKITLPDNLTAIGPYAFQCCERLSGIVFPEGITVLPYYVLYGCNKLTNVTIPASVTEIGDEALAWCSNLSSVTFQGGAPAFGYSAFNGTTTTVYYPAGNDTWNADVMQDYCGSITWVALGEVTGLEIISAPAGCCVGEEPDLSGLVVMLIYSNGIQRQVDVEELTISAIDTSAVGRYTVTVTYGDISAEFVYGVHEGSEETLLDAALYPESEHNYADNMDDTQTVIWPGALSLTLVFSENTFTEESCDPIYIYDGAGNEIGCYSGGTLAGATVVVPGDTAQIRLSTDSSVTYYGYSLTGITAKTLIHTGTQTDSGIEATCTEQGRTEGRICEICGAIYDYEIINALGHDYEAVVTEPTPEEDGYTTHTCRRCGDSYTDSITVYGALANGTCGESLSWKLMEDDGMLFIYGEGAMDNYYDYGTKQAPWNEYRDRITGVVVEDGVTSIGRHAFTYCEKMETAQIADSVTEIGDNAFSNCSSLENIVIPDSVATITFGTFFACTELRTVSIGAGVTVLVTDAFDGCNSLTSFYVDENNTCFASDNRGVLFNKEMTTLIKVPSKLSGAYEIPDGVTVVDDFAVTNCSGLTSLELPDSLISIGYNTFADCTGLESVTFNSGLAYIGEFAFRGCSSLTELVIPDSVEHIRDYAFDGCVNLRSLTLGSGLVYLGYGAFRNSALTSVTIPASVTELGYDAFMNSTNLTGIFVDEANPNYASDASGVLYDKAMTTLMMAPGKLQGTYRIGASVTNIYYEAFIGCSELTGFSVDEENQEYCSDEYGVLYVKNKFAIRSFPRGFAGDYVIPESVTSLDFQQFFNCPYLTGITFHAGIEVFDHMMISGCTGLTAFHVVEENPYLSSDDRGVLFNKDKSILIMAPAAISGSYTVPGTVTEIGDSAFYACTNLESISVPESVTELGYDAFGDCTSLESVSIPEGVTVIRSCTFRNCTSLENVEIPNSVTNIVYSSFENCTSLQNVTIPESVDSIGWNVFANCEKLDTVKFRGDAPAFMDEVFKNVVATVCYPSDNVTWTPDVMQNYGGTLTWVAYRDVEVVAEGTCGEALTWVLTDDGTLTISGEGAMYDFAEGDAPWQTYVGTIKAFVLEEGITYIGDYAFVGYTAWTTIEIPASVKGLGTCAIKAAQCTQMVFTGDAPETKADTFSGVSGFVHYPYSNSTWSDAYKQAHIQEQVIWCPDDDQGQFIDMGGAGRSLIWILDQSYTLKLIGSGEMEYPYAADMPWIEYCADIRSVELPEGLTNLRQLSLNGLQNVETITIPSTVARIETHALEYTKGATLYFQGDAPEIAEMAFCGAELTICYPAGNATWTTDVMQDYDGTITWVPYGEVVPEEIASGWSGDTSWTLTDDGILTFSGQGAMKNYTTKTAMPWYEYRDQIRTVVIGDGITRIGSYAFYEMPVLESVAIADSVTIVGDYAFKNSGKLRDVKLPSGLTGLGESAFYACTSLTSIDIPAYVWTIKPYTFKNCTNLTSVTFHEGNLQKISDGAFYGTGLTELVLPDCLDILDVYAFKGCANLTDITIGSGITELREAVFYGTAIPAITIPEGITKIGPYAFKNCVELETIKLPESLASVGEASFYACTALKTVELPDAVTTIGNYAFRKCTAIETLTFGSELTSIGECAFYGCTALTEIVIPDKVTTIKPYAFKTCSGLTSVTLGSSVETIGEGAFNTCTGLKTIVFPASLTSIGNYCFSGSWNLWKLTFQGNAPGIGTGAFKGMAATAYYPADNATWTAEIMQNYGGKITWTAK